MHCAQLQPISSMRRFGLEAKRFVFDLVFFNFFASVFSRVSCRMSSRSTAWLSRVCPLSPAGLIGRGVLGRFLELVLEMDPKELCLSKLPLLVGLAPPTNARTPSSSSTGDSAHSSGSLWSAATAGNTNGTVIRFVVVFLPPVPGSMLSALFLVWTALYPASCGSAPAEDMRAVGGGRVWAAGGGRNGGFSVADRSDQLHHHFVVFLVREFCVLAFVLVSERSSYSAEKSARFHQAASS